ncbi:AAA family ATPase, partial [Patescibacteria group bacterium]|nr:AAA family ATPase [Patescibacteria group bacterium]
KPPLARGELQAVGATTLKEYHKYIEKDPALARRFQPVYVAEPSVEDTIAMLRGLKHKYELHHGITITDEALVAAAQLSSRYISDRFLPDKAVDLIDEAASSMRLDMDSKPKELDDAEREITRMEIEKESLKKEKTKSAKARMSALQKSIDAIQSETKTVSEKWKKERELIALIGGLKKELALLRQESDMREREGNFERVAEIRYGRIPSDERKLRESESTLQKLQSGRKLLKEVVGAEEIAEVVARWTNIPVTKMLEGELKKLLTMEQILRERVIGQDEALAKVSNALRRSRSGIQDEDRPLASFIFLGATGVGKTELAKALASFMFNDEKALIRFDMSEFMERHTVSKFIGSPAGYVGYEEGGKLTELVKHRPYSVILFDEIEKAHPEIFNILLQILDNGRLTDAKGQTVNFKNTIIIMTSNIGGEFVREIARLGFVPEEASRNEKEDDLKHKIRQALERQFRPEFLNRIDEIIIFNSLSPEIIGKIADIQLNRVALRMKQKGIGITFSENLKKFIAEKGYEPHYGARPLKRAIQNFVLDRLAEQLVGGEIKEGDAVLADVDAQKNEVVFLRGVSRKGNGVKKREMMKSTK